MNRSRGPDPRETPADDPEHPSFQCWRCGSRNTTATVGALRELRCKRGCTPGCPHRFQERDADVVCNDCGLTWVEGGAGDALMH